MSVAMVAGLKLSIVIPAYNEESCIEETVRALAQRLRQDSIEYEILVVNDHSKDGTPAILARLTRDLPGFRFVNNENAKGFGNTVRCGLDHFTGDAVAVYMADASDRPEDLVAYVREMQATQVDCVFGTRWGKGGRVVDYPKNKLLLNRAFNLVVKVLFNLPYNDVTNAFKLYSREAIDGARPLISPHFNLTVELPLKCIVRGYSFSVVPNWWINRKSGVSNLKIKEMGSRYLFILFYCLIEKWLSRGDYYRKPLGI